ncbi:hypothetical protein [Agrococcus sp. DT81.2]|uniref:hypothetical protein n=1 Tax=Agrococcus sp. DT81.2 TaxID=3393414 RepID=UPI003CE44B6D
MSRGEAQRVAFPDGYSTVDVMVEVERALDEAASAAYVDMKRREYEDAQENHLLHYGYDRPDLMGVDS